MTDVAHVSSRQQIVVDEVFPHAPEVIWRALTTGEIMARWLMEPRGFEPVIGNRFTYQTKPAGAWDGTIHCEVLEVVENQRFSHAWRGGDASNTGYGSKLDTVVTWNLEPGAGGRRHACPPRPFWFRTAEKRGCLPQHGRRLESGRSTP